MKSSINEEKGRICWLVLDKNENRFIWTNSYLNARIALLKLTHGVYVGNKWHTKFYHLKNNWIEGTDFPLRVFEPLK